MVKKRDASRYATTSIASKASLSASASKGSESKTTKSKESEKVEKKQDLETLSKYAKKTAAAQSSKETIEKPAEEEITLSHPDFNYTGSMKLRKSVDGWVNPVFPKVFDGVGIPAVTFPFSFSTNVEGAILEKLDLISHYERSMPKDIKKASNLDESSLLTQCNISFLSLQQMGYDDALIRRAFTSVADPNNFVHLLGWCELVSSAERVEQEKEAAEKARLERLDASPVKPSTKIESSPLSKKSNSIDKDLELKERILAQFENQSSGEEDMEDLPPNLNASIQPMKEKKRRKGDSVKESTEALSKSISSITLDHEKESLKHQKIMTEKNFVDEQASEHMVIESLENDPMMDLLNSVLQEPMLEDEPDKDVPLESENAKVDEPDDFEVDLFDDDNGLPKEESVKVVTVPVREFEIGKWSGKTPKQYLSDYCRRLTKSNEGPKFSPVKGRKAPGGHLMSVTLKLEPSPNAKPITYEMNDEATRTVKEAEHYVATMALYDLNKQSSMYNSLPSCYKDLWLEWIKRDKFKGIIEQNELDSSRLSFLKGIIKEKLKIWKSSSSESSKASLSGSTPTLVSKHRSYKPLQADPKMDQALKDYLLRLAKGDQHQKHLRTRQALPIYQRKEEILDAFYGSDGRNQVLVVSGLTGSGKSTQIPQIILESEIMAGRASSTSIICTQPRRISALSISKRVSEEMGEPRLGQLVGYQIKLESVASEQTKLLFCTTGILLKRLESDPELNSVSCVIIDEVHERSIESDFLLVILKSILARRKDLRVVLMSATVDAEKFSQYFGNCPVVKVEGRLFDVSSHFLEDMIEMCGYSLDSQSEFAKPFSNRKGAKTYRVNYSSGRGNTSTHAEDVDDEFAWLMTGDLPPEFDCLVSVEKQDEARYSGRTLKSLYLYNEYRINFELCELFIEWLVFDAAKDPIYKNTIYSDTGAILVFMPGWLEIKTLCNLLSGNPKFAKNPEKFWILPLHSSLSGEEQSKVFETPPKGTRKIVVATNVAETGITIPDVVYVIDSGKSKEIRHESGRRLTKLEETFVSQDNVKQRSGRAGRVTNGHCFHLYTNYRFRNKFRSFQTCEMLRLPLEDLCLRIKLCVKGENNSIIDFLSSAIDPPLESSVKQAITSLYEIGALDDKENLTCIGKYIVSIPVDVILAKLCIFAVLNRCLDPILTIVACLSHSKSIFANSTSDNSNNLLARKYFIPNDKSDLLMFVNAFAEWKRLVASTPGGMNNFNTLVRKCKASLLSHYDLCQVEAIKDQIYGNMIDAGLIARKLSNAEQYYNSNANDMSLLKSTLAIGLYPNLLQVDNAPSNKFNSSGSSTSTTVLRWINNAKPGTQFDQVFWHPSSMMTSNLGPLLLPNTWISFFRMIKSTKMYVFDGTVIPLFPIILHCHSVDYKFISKNLVLIDKTYFLDCNCKRTILILKRLRELFNECIESSLAGDASAVSKSLSTSSSNSLPNLLKIIEL